MRICRCPNQATKLLTGPAPIKWKKMKIEQATIYRCDHCGKVQFRKGDMTKHEKWYKLNPTNLHACFKFCQNLIKSEERYEVDGGYSAYGNGYSGMRTVFTCKVTGMEMYSFIAERRKLPVVNDGNSIRMPIQCDHYKNPENLIDDSNF